MKVTHWVEEYEDWFREYPAAKTLSAIIEDCSRHKHSPTLKPNVLCLNCGRYKPTDPGIEIPNPMFMEGGIVSENNSTMTYVLNADDPFEAELIEMAKLQRKKGQDYGSEQDPNANLRAIENFGISDWVGCAIRMNDKMFRVQSFCKKGWLANESIEDSFRDIAVYAIKALNFLKEKASQ